MNTCSKCHNQKPELPSAVLEIVQNEAPVLFHKVIFPASLGDDTTVPPDTLDYKNVLLVYEANGNAYLYSSDGAATFISMAAVDFSKIEEQLTQHGVQIEELQQTTEEIQSHITNLEDELSTTNAAVESNASSIATVNNRVTTVSILTNQTKSELDALSTIVSNQADEISNAQGDIAELQTTTSANTTNIATNTSNIATLTSDMATTKDDIVANTQNIDQNTSAIDAIKTGLDVYVEKETDFNGNDSTLDVVHTKINMNDGSTQETTDALPVASETSAGIMNAATYSAVQENSENVDSILNGAVALNDLPESPTQDDLTTKWKTATRKTELVNRASIFDVTNNKLWYYYTNANMWYGVAAEGSTVTVNQATNESLGTVKGSTKSGQTFVESDGTQSVNEWDKTQANISTLQSTVSEQGELLQTTVDQLEETQKDANDALADIAAIQADYVSKTKVVQDYSTAKDEVNSAKFINDKLNSLTIALGAGAATGLYSTAYGNNAKATSLRCIAIGYNSTANSNDAEVFGYGATSGHANSIALGSSSKTSRTSEVSIGGGGTENTSTRYLANVRTGVLDTDAVNVKQMQDYVAEHGGSGQTTGIRAFMPTVTDYTADLEDSSFGTEPELGQMVAIGIASGTTVLRYITLNGGTSYPVYTNGVTTAGSNASSIGVNLRTGLLIICVFCGTQWRTVNVGRSVGTADLTNGAVTIDKISSDSIMTIDEFNTAWEAA